MNKTRIRIFIGVIIVGLLCSLIYYDISYMRTKEELKAIQQELADYQVDEAEIYPCPFCGSENVELKESYGYYVRCKDCGGTGPAHGPNDVWWENTKTDAIEWWNAAYKMGNL